MKRLLFIFAVVLTALTASAENYILYTSEDGKVVRPCETDVFGAKIVSNTYNDGQGKITFDGPVTMIGDYAFSGCESLTSATIPNSVTTIGKGAFVKCTSLKAFYGKFASSDRRCLVVNRVLMSFAPAGLTSYTIPNTVTTIGRESFRQCSDLTSITIPNSITTIGDLAFMACEGLKSITIPNSVTTIETAAFQGTGLISVTIPNSVTTLGDGAFCLCANLNSFYGKFASNDHRYLIINGILKSFAPAGLTSYAIPNSVTRIGDYVFGHCKSLTSVTIPSSVTAIGKGALSWCTSLTSITIPNSVTTIGDWAFRGCSGLTSVTIPNSVTTIGDWAFYQCI